MIKNNNRNSRDDKSKAGGSNTGRRPAGSDKPKTRFNDKDSKNNAGFDKRETGDRRKSGFATGEKKEYKPRTARDGDTKPYASSKSSFDKDFRSKTDNERGNFKPWEKKEGTGSYKSRPANPKAAQEGKRAYVKKDKYAQEGETPFAHKKSTAPRSMDSRPYRKRDEQNYKRKEDRGERVAPTLRSRKAAEPKDDGLIRLNRYIANSGICSRRKADELIEAGVISVNGAPVTELGHKIDPYKDEVRYNGELLKREKKVYVLLNKPKDYITTTDDPQERKTVMQLVEKASRERIYPVGRLDRNTTGLILMTNDGELADKLSHPRNGITKIYHVELNKNLSQGDFNKIQFGLELEDGLIKPDNVSYVAGASKKEIGIQIHSGKNRIVRRIFEHLGYDVVKLDRVVYGNLTKKDLPRGRWRFLEEHELVQIKHLIK